MALCTFALYIKIFLPAHLSGQESTTENHGFLSRFILWDTMQPTTKAILFCFVLFSPKASDSETQPIKQAKLSRSGQVRVGTKQS